MRNKNPDANDAVVVIVLDNSNTRCWVGVTHTPKPLLPIDESPGAFASAVTSALRLTTLKGRRVVCVGAPTFHRRVTVSHAMLALLKARSVRFMDIPTAARIAAEVSDAFVVYVEAVNNDKMDNVLKQDQSSALDQPPVTYVYRAGVPEVVGVGASETVLTALSNATVPERADAAQRIVVCGDKLPGQFLRELRALATNDPRFSHLSRLVQVARVVATPYNPALLHWFGGVILAKADIDVGYVINAEPWIKHGALALPDEDAIAPLTYPDSKTVT